MPRSQISKMGQRCVMIAFDKRIAFFYNKCQKIFTVRAISKGKKDMTDELDEQA